MARTASRVSGLSRASTFGPTDALSGLGDSRMVCRGGSAAGRMTWGIARPVPDGLHQPGGAIAASHAPKGCRTVPANAPGWRALTHWGAREPGLRLRAHGYSAPGC